MVDSPVVSQLPPVNVPVMEKGGNLTLPWRRFFETQWRRSGGFSDDVWAALFLGTAYQSQIVQLQGQLDEAQDALASLRSDIAAIPRDQGSLDELATEVASLRVGLANRDRELDVVSELKDQVAALTVQLAEANLQTQQLVEQAASDSDQAQFQFQSLTATQSSDKYQLAQDVTSVGDQVAALTTDDIPEGGTNEYFTTARARLSISATGSLSYNNTTGVLSYSQPTLVSTFTNDAGYLTGITSGQVTGALGYTPVAPGAYAVSAAPPIIGYVPMKDSGGTVRNFAVV